MFRFFRQLRKQSTGEAKAYLLYAIGEVFLVIVGILIALQINNWSEDRKERQTIDSILLGIQQDLLSDIREAEAKILWYEQREYVIKDLLEGEVDEEFDEFIYSAGMFWNTYVLNTSSFEALNAHKDIIPSEYRDIDKRLNELYIQTSSSLQTRQRYIDEHLSKYRSQLVDEEPWYVDYQLGNYTEEVQNYFLTSERHRQKLVRFLTLSEDIRFSLQQIIRNARYNYVVIHNVLDNPEPYSHHLNLPDLEVSTSKGRGLSGTYFEDEFQTEVRINQVNKVFTFTVDSPQLIDSEPYLLVDLPGDTLGSLVDPGSYIVIQRDDRNRVTGINVYQDLGLQSVMSKIE